MSTRPSSPFDRVRPRTGQPEPTNPTGTRPADPDGKRALFSTGPAKPATGSVTVTCSRCQRSTVLGVRQVARLLVPSVHLPLLRRHYASMLRCPACAQVSWVSLHLNV